MTLLCDGHPLTTLERLVDVQLSPISTAEQGLSETPLHLDKVILITPWLPAQPWFPHLVQLFVDHRDLCYSGMSQPGHVSKGKQNFLLSWRLSCSTFRQKDFSEEVSRLAAAPRRLSINHMYEEWWLHFVGWATKQGIDSLGPTATQVAAFLLPSVETMVWLLRWSGGVRVEHTRKEPKLQHRTIPDIQLSRWNTCMLRPSTSMGSQHGFGSIV